MWLLVQKGATLVRDLQGNKTEKKKERERALLKKETKRQGQIYQGMQ
jgi:hypothetical protein